MAPKSAKSPETGTQNAQERPPRKRSVAVVLDPENLEKLETFAKEDGPALAPSTLARLLLEVGLQERELAGSWKVFREEADERLRLRREGDHQAKPEKVKINVETKRGR